MTDVIVKLFEKLGPVGRMFPYKKPTFIQFVKFVLVGIVSSLINLTILYSLTEFLSVYYLYSAAFALFFSAINGYTLNNLWTFKTDGVRRHKYAFSKFLVLIISTYLFNLTILATLVEVFGIWYIFAEIIAILIAMTGNFLGSKYWVFKQNKH